MQQNKRFLIIIEFYYQNKRIPNQQFQYVYSSTRSMSSSLSTTSLLEQLVSNISQSQMQTLTQFLPDSDTQNISETHKQPPLATIESCTKHHNKKGEFYQSQYPWIRYCQVCALNLALCGKKIQKCLNSQQMFNKMKLCDFLKSINTTIKSAEHQHNQYSQLSQHIHQTRSSFTNVIGSIDKLITQLTETRNHLQHSIQTSLNIELKHILQKQSLIISKKIELINEKSRIQCGFSDLLDDKKEKNEQMTTMVDKCQTIMNQLTQMELKENYHDSLSHKINQLQLLFNTKIQEMKERYLDFNKNIEMAESSHPQNNTRKHEAKTEPAQPASEYTLSSPTDRVFTAYSTIQNSGLVSPCCQLNMSEIPFNEHNPKTTKTTLQLKPRCKSKSRQKKVSINVRENVQQCNKKKIL